LEKEKFIFFVFEIFGMLQFRWQNVVALPVGHGWLCEKLEHCNHNFFTCIMARFMQVGVRQLLHNNWNPHGARNFITLAQVMLGPLLRSAWFTFAAQCWVLLNIRNKLTIKGN
jgi:hypothetical protein